MLRDTLCIRLCTLQASLDEVNEMENFNSGFCEKLNCERLNFVAINLIEIKENV